MCKILFVPAALLLAFSASAQSADAPIADVEMALIADRVPIVAVQVNDRKGLNFIPDSGASDEILDASLARALGIRVIDPTLVPQPGGAVEIGKTSGAAIKVDRSALGQWPFVTAPIKPLGSFLGRSFHGILGQRLFDHYVVEFDYQRKRMRLHNSARFAYRGQGVTLPIERPDGRLFVRVGLKGADGAVADGLVQLDTGSFEALGLEGPDVARAKLIADTAPRIPLFGLAIGGGTTGYRARLSQLTLGPFVINSPAVSVTTSANAGNDPQSLGVLGGGVLNRFRVIVDASRKQLILEPNAAFIGPIDHWDASGLVLVSPEPFSRVLVHGVLQGSPAERAGLAEGD